MMIRTLDQKCNIVYSHFDDRPYCDADISISAMVKDKDIESLFYKRKSFYAIPINADDHPTIKRRVGPLPDTLDQICK